MSKLWVIGGSSGIGAAIAKQASASWEVNATGIELDVRNWKQMASFLKKNGPFDAVVYSAGINRLNWIIDVEESEAIDLLRVNVLGFAGLLKSLLSTQSSGRIIAISSDAADRPMRTSLIYCASKSALNSMVKTAAREMAPNWQINALCPGITEPTNMQEYIDVTVPTIRGWTSEKAKEYEKSQIPMQRRAHPDEIALAALKMLEFPQYFTGALVSINGGR